MKLGTAVGTAVGMAVGIVNRKKLVMADRHSY